MVACRVVGEPALVRIVSKVIAAASGDRIEGSQPGGEDRVANSEECQGAGLRVRRKCGIGNHDKIIAVVGRGEVRDDQNIRGRTRDGSAGIVEIPLIPQWLCAVRRHGEGRESALQVGCPHRLSSDRGWKGVGYVVDLVGHDAVLGADTNDLVARNICFASKVGIGGVRVQEIIDSKEMVGLGRQVGGQRASHKIARQVHTQSDHAGIVATVRGGQRRSSGIGVEGVELHGGIGGQLRVHAVPSAEREALLPNASSSQGDDRRGKIGAVGSLEKYPFGIGAARNNNLRIRAAAAEGHRIAPSQRRPVAQICIKDSRVPAYTGFTVPSINFKEAATAHSAKIGRINHPITAN